MSKNSDPAKSLDTHKNSGTSAQDSILNPVDGVAERLVDIETSYLQGIGEVPSRGDIIRRLAVSSERVNIREAEEAGKGSASPEFLRRHVPVNLRRKLGVQVMGADQGILRVVSKNRITAKQEEMLLESVREVGINVHAIAYEARPLKETENLLKIGSQTTEVQLRRNLMELSLRAEDASGEFVRSNINAIIDNALELRASDIHFKNTTLQDEISSNWIFYRVDGDLRPAWLLSSQAMKVLISVLKQQAGMDHTDRNRPQDGRIHHRWENRSIDIRAASAPMHGGERLTLRLLDTGNDVSLSDIFSGESELVSYIKRLVNKSSKDGGVILLSGPTGSGKSTTMAAMVREVPRHKRNVITIEDPVEYRVPLVDQIEVNKQVGQDFATILRSIMRHDPDFIGIGEMRDPETAEAAMAAAETGHIVLSTVHAIGAIPTVERVLSLFAENFRVLGGYMLGTSLRAVVNQRLAPKLCPSCARSGKAGDIVREDDALNLRTLGISEDDDVREINPDGCSICDYSGILGRTLVPEILIIPADPKIRDKVTNWVVNHKLEHLRELNGYHPRKDVLKDLVMTGAVGLRTALTMLDEEYGAQEDLADHDHHKDEQESSEA